MPLMPPVSLPDYRLRISRRCKRVLLRVSPLGMIEVVVPEGFDLRRVPDIVQQRQPWLEKQLGKLAAQWQAAPEEQALRPEKIRLRALAREWRVEYRPSAGRSVRLKDSGSCLHLSCPAERETEAEALIGRRLQRWLQEQARARLLPWLAQTAEELGLEYAQARIRAQKTRWGSCSARGVINLNRNLLFLPPELVRYLFVHELSHTRHMDHSPRFWRQVAACEPDYRRLDARLNRAGKYLPRWVHI